MPRSSSRRPARGVAHDIRSRTDEELVALLTARPDLALQRPTDLEALVNRSLAPFSLARAIDTLDIARLRALDAATRVSTITAGDVARELDAKPNQVEPLLADLWTLGLLWWSGTGYRMSGAVPTAIGHLGGLDIEAAPAGLTPPELTLTAHDPARIDSAAGVRAGDVLDLIDELAERWGQEPPKALGRGGLPKREFTRTATALGLDTHGLAMLVEIMGAARLVTESYRDDVLAPTELYDVWAERDDATRWAELVTTWLSMARAPHIVGRRAEKGLVNALTSDVTLTGIVDLRRRTLDLLAECAPGEAPRPFDLQDRLRWHRPRVPERVIADMAPALLEEAERLGLTSAGALTTAGRVLLARSDRARIAAAADLPATVSHVVVQNDLTAIAPGRLDRPTATFLRQVALIESRGGASTFRFTEESLSRMLDQGWSADALLEALARTSLTPLPQTVEVLVGDVARRHGRAIIGSTNCYVRSDDAVVLDDLLARPKAAAVLRRLAPTVAVSSLSANKLLALLRDLGVHALVEGADGAVVTHVPAPTRTPTPGGGMDVRGVDAAVVEAVVATLRSAERGKTDPDGSPTAAAARSRATMPDPAATTAAIQVAIAERRAVVIEVVDRHGDLHTRLVHPTRVQGGLVHGRDLDTGGAQTWAISRIASALIR